MAEIVNGKLHATNAEILNEIRKYAPQDYQQRIPAATQGSAAESIKALNQYPNDWNTAIDILHNQIGRRLVRDKSFTTKFTRLFGESLTYGTSVQEMQVNLLRAKTYDKDALDVWTVEGREPDVHVNYHTMNTKLKYELQTPMEDMLRGAFDASQSLDSLMNSIYAKPKDSLENDTQLNVMRMLGHYQQFEDGGFYNIHVDDVATADDPAAACRKIAKIVRQLKTDTDVYNTIYSPEGRTRGLATRTSGNIVVIPSTVDANLTVEMMAYMFNEQNGELLADRIITVPQAQMDELVFPGCQLLWLDEDFFVCHNNLGPIQLTAPMNPLNMYQLSVLHCWQTISYSRFCNAIALSTMPDTEVAEINSTVTGVTLTDANGQDNSMITPQLDLMTGGVLDPSVRLSAVVQGANFPSQAVRFDLAAYNGRGKAMTVPDRCYVDSLGVLHAGNVPAGTVLKVTATSLQDETKSATYTATVEGSKALTALAANPASVTVKVGKSATFMVTTTPKDATDPSFTASLATGTDNATIKLDRIHSTVTVTGVKVGDASVSLVATGADGTPITKSVSVTVQA